MAAENSRTNRTSSTLTDLSQLRTFFGFFALTSIIKACVFIALSQKAVKWRPSVDAFEVGNELGLYDADVPKTSEFAKHNWKWFLTPEQDRAFAAGYAPFLKTFVTVIREYFLDVKISTCGMSNPTGNSMPLIQAIANFTDASGKTFDYTTLVDGYGSHLYLPSDSTLNAVTRATDELTSQAATLPHIQEKPIWITGWNGSASAF